VPGEKKQFKQQKFKVYDIPFYEQAEHTMMAFSDDSSDEE
jgi:hypothetical protein